MFDSPFAFCPHCGEMVLLDQTQRECGREHGCKNGMACPLADWFSGIDFRGDERDKGKPDVPGK